MSWKNSIKEEPEQAPVSVSSWKDTIQEEEPASPSQGFSVPSEVKSLAGGAVVGTGGAAVGALINKAAAAPVVKKVAETLGPYTPSQLENITQNYDVFNKLDPISEFENVEENVRSFNRIANDKQQEAYAQLTQGLSREEFRKTAAQANLPRAFDLDASTPSFLEEVEKNLPKTKSVDPLKTQYEQKLNEYADLKAKQKIDALNRANLGTLSPEALQAEYLAAKNEALKNPKDFSFVPDQEALKIADLQSQQEKSRAVSKAYSRALKNKTSKYASEFPEYATKAEYDPFNTSLDDVLKQYPEAVNLSGEQTYKLVQDLRNQGWGVGGVPKNEAAAASAKAIRTALGEKNLEFGELMSDASKDIESLKELQKAGYITRDKALSPTAPEFIKINDAQTKKIVKDIAPNLISNNPQLTKDSVERLAKLKQFLKPEDFQKLELAVLKSAKDMGKFQAKIGPIDALGAVATVSSGNPGYMAAQLAAAGVKASKTAGGAIAASRLADNLAQFKGLTGKLLPGALGLAGGVLGASAAAEAGEITPGEAAVLAPIEALNPTPLDAVGAYAAGKKEYQESGSIPATALAGAQGAVQPMIDLARITPQIIKEASAPQGPNPASLRERYERDLESFKELKKPFKPTAPSHSVEDIQATHDWFKASTDPVAQTYAGPLEKAANSQDERTRAAVMFGLEQQPAFRELQRKQKLGQ